MKAQLNNYRQSPRKVRLVADLVKGKKVSEAVRQLELLPKRASHPVTKLIKSALANATSADVALTADSLTIKDLRVDQGATLRRQRPRARGSAYRINKRTSQIQIELTKIQSPDTKLI